MRLVCRRTATTMFNIGTLRVGLVINTCVGPGSIPGKSMWDLWWIKWHWDRFFPECFGFPLSISFHRCSITWKNEKKNFIFIRGLHNKPQGCGASVAAAAGPFTSHPKKNMRCNSSESVDSEKNRTWASFAWLLNACCVVGSYECCVCHNTSILDGYFWMLYIL
jgi:hypothetical protein